MTWYRHIFSCNGKKCFLEMSVYKNTHINFFSAYVPVILRGIQVCLQGISGLEINFFSHFFKSLD